MRPGNGRFGRWPGALCSLLLGALLLAGCSSTPPETVSPGAPLGGYYKLGKPYRIDGRWYYPTYDPAYAAVGVASWYGHPFHGRKTANGELYDMELLTAAHPTLPLPSVVRVTNLANQRQLELRVNDRGPFVDDRIIDLSQAAARALGFERSGTTQVRVEFVRLADADGVPPAPTTPELVAAVRSQERPLVAPQERPPAAPAPAAAPQVVRVAAAQPVGKPLDQVAARDASGKRCLSAGFIQVGAFVESERALLLARQLDAAVALPVSADLPTVDRYARVRLGPIADQQQADAALRWLHQAGHVNAYQVRPDAAASVAC